ncbi:MAG: hypothetical protein ACRD4P_02580, partial [Bryobacteraceae bacterium]
DWLVLCQELFSEIVKKLLSGQNLVLGMARPKISWVAMEKMLKVSGTGRNWNSVTKLLALAETLEP